jgi:hypothetical protein
MRRRTQLGQHDAVEHAAHVIEADSGDRVAVVTAREAFLHVPSARDPAEELPATDELECGTDLGAGRYRCTFLGRRLRCSGHLCRSPHPVHCYGPRSDCRRRSSGPGHRGRASATIACARQLTAQGAKGVTAGGIQDGRACDSTYPACSGIRIVRAQPVTGVHAQEPVAPVARANAAAAALGALIEPVCASVAGVACTGGTSPARVADASRDTEVARSHTGPAPSRTAAPPLSSVREPPPRLRASSPAPPPKFPPSRPLVRSRSVARVMTR